MPKPHTVIAGTGRSGTTLLVELLTELGLDTGFSKSDYTKQIDPISNAGLEFDLQNADFENLPRIIKSPYFYKFADNVLNNDHIFIENVLIPVRMLDQSAKSRIRVQVAQEELQNTKILGDVVSGGLTGTNSMEDQEIVLGRQLTALIKSMAKSNTPHIFLAFPTFALNPEYLFKSINFLLPDISFEHFLETFQKVVRPELIHSYNAPETKVSTSLDMQLILNEISQDQYLFGVEDYLHSAWIGHAPFMKFIIRELKPKIFVELGVHNGFSYFVGCQAIKECSLATKAFAVDHWEGDRQAGFFDDFVYQSASKLNIKYSDFSTLIKSSFIDALTKFENEIIDLLHIDGFHSYESVKEDFETWLPKMSKNGVILLHDIHVRRDTFGVYEFWKEVKEEFNTIEFVGSHGLGVVFLGVVPKGRLLDLFTISKNGGLAQIQGTFGSISDDVIQTFRKRDSAVAERDSAVAERDSAVAERDSLLNSKTWRILQPYRSARDLFRKN